MGRGETNNISITTYYSNLPFFQLGITPINTFDAFNLRPGGEYKFRVTPRNRYGWGEPVTMTNSVLVSESTDLPEFTKILPGQLKALEGTSIKLECEVRLQRVRARQCLTCFTYTRSNNINFRFAVILKWMYDGTAKQRR